MAGILLNRNRQVPAEETPAFGGIAERFRRAGDLDRAIALCRDGLKRFPNQLSARVTLGWALLDKGQYEAARAELEQVLRRAPDNLAAIRGMAELHDRSEGTLSAEHESWKSEDTASPAAVSARGADAPVAPSVNGIAHIADSDPLAPIHVALRDSAREQEPPQVLHTADHAELAAEAAAAVPFEGVVDLVVSPVEFEDAMSATMAAATEPVPFFVDPAEAALVAAVQAAVPIETFEPAAPDAILSLAADATVEPVLQIEDPSAPSFQIEDVPSATALGVQGDETDSDWAALAAALAEDASVQTEDNAVLRDAAPVHDPVWSGEQTVVTPVVDSEPDLGLQQSSSSDVDATLNATADWISEQETELAAFGSPEMLDDVDEMAGLELADAIKALEDAARRVEAKLAPPPPSNEPAAGRDAIAAFEFVDASGAPIVVSGAGTIDDAPSPVIDTALDGAFELVAPDLTNLELGSDSVVTGVEIEDQAGDVDVEAAGMAYTPELSFGVVPDEPAHDAVVEASGFLGDPGLNAASPAGSVDPAPSVPPAEAGWGFDSADSDARDPEMPVAAFSRIDPADAFTTVASVERVVANIAPDPVLHAVPVVERAAPRRSPPLVALERFLRQVQARQLELRSETVA